MSIIKKLKPGKISIVVFLTALIWVWADLSQDEPLPLSGVRIEIAKFTDPTLWVNFVVEGANPSLQPAVTLDTIDLKGPASRVTEVGRRWNRGVLDLNLFVVPDQEGLTQPGVHTLNVLEFLKRSDAIRQLGLAVESCDPNRLTIQTRTLVEQSVEVECVGIDSSLEVASLDPPSVMAYVPSGETMKATIQLTSQDRNQAKNAPIVKTPFLLIAGQRREVSTKVKVTLVAAQNVLTEEQIPAAYGFCFSPNLQGKYRVVLDKDTDSTALTGVRVRGTDAARRAYREASPQIVLYIWDQDAQTPPDQRSFEFRFPEEYVGRGEIEANQPPPTVKFTLERLPEASPEPES